MLDALMGARDDVKERAQDVKVKAQEAAQGLNEKMKVKAQDVKVKAQESVQGLNEKMLNNVVARVRPLLIQDIIKALQTIQNTQPQPQKHQASGGGKKTRRKKTRRKKTRRKKTKKYSKKYSNKYSKKYSRS